MSDKVRILGIAPYEEMRELMIEVAGEYPQIDLTMSVGDRELGLSIAKESFHGNYDVIISRGGTAQMLKRRQPLPVVEIEVSTYNLLYSLRMAGSFEGKAAVVCSDNIADSAQRIVKLTDMDMDIRVYDSQISASEIVNTITPGEYGAVLCDTVAYKLAGEKGLDVLLIRSDAENIRQAFEQALLLCRSQQRLRDENQFLRELLDWQIGYTTILDDDGGLYLSTMETVQPDLLEMLRRELPESRSASERRITRSLNGQLYVIRIRRIFIGSTAHTAFFYDIRRTPIASGHAGIRPYNRPEVEERYHRSILCISRLSTEKLEENARICSSNAPVLVMGEDGTDLEAAIDLIYLNGPLRNNPQIAINCAALGEKEWDFLLDHYNSPLADEGSTLYFINADAIPASRCRRLVSVIKFMRSCSRNRVFFSCLKEKGASLSLLAREIVDELGCLTMEMPALREISARIPRMVEGYLDFIRTDMPHELTGAEPAALELLQQYQWPHNYAQFRRIMNELVLIAKGDRITTASVRMLLRKERYVGAVAGSSENADSPLDLTRTLEEIDREIVRRVIEENNGNQTAAAKRLGISRTTLWRMIQSPK